MANLRGFRVALGELGKIALHVLIRASRGLLSKLPLEFGHSLRCSSVHNAGDSRRRHIRKYRRHGLGKWAAFRLFDRFPGLWQLKRTPRNTGSVVFWDKVVGGYTKGDFKLESRADLAYDDGTPADLFTFRTDGARGE